jgi:hypothetical protein
MSTRGADLRGAAVSFAPKLNVRSEAGDPLDRAAQHTLDLLHRAAVAAEANNQQALEAVDKLSAQLRAAEDRIRELDTKRGITRKGRTEPRGGCIKSQWRLSRIS